MSEKRWVPVEWADCPECGDCAEIHTDSDKEDYFYDGDEARCMVCKSRGWFSCDTETPGYIIWEDDLR